MIDFVKIVIKDKALISTVWKNENLIFLSDQDRRIGDEIRTFQKKSYRGLTFTLFDDKLEITGSLHKYFNNGIHNANDFSFVECINIIYQLESVLELDLNDCQVINLEYGLNIVTTETVKNVVVWLRFHERNEFRYFPDLQYAKQAAKFSRGRINTYKIIKGYAKGLQLFDGRAYGDPNTFRLEVRSKQSKYINKVGVYTLADLINPSTYYQLAEELLKEWSNVVILDKSLQGTNDKLDKYLNQDYWENCLNDHRNKFSRERNKYFSLLKKHPANIHYQITKHLKEKLARFGHELKSGAISTPFELTSTKESGAISTPPNNTFQSNDGAISTPIELTSTKESGAYSTIVKVESAPTSKICTETGLTIPDVQQPHTTNLTETGVRWYYENEPEIYKEKLKTILTERWKKANKYKPKKVWHKKIYHEIRNTQSNPRNNLFRSYKNIESKGLKLFLLEETIPANKMKIINKRREQEALEQL